jgi:hypothetical protein
MNGSAGYICVTRKEEVRVCVGILEEAILGRKGRDFGMVAY